MLKIQTILLFFVQIILAKLPSEEQKTSVNKCCENMEIYVDNSCRYALEVNELPWAPIFTTQNGKVVKNLTFR